MKNRLVIIDALEMARESQGLTQAELASRAGTSRVTVGRIESGFDPKLSTVYELARALGLELTLVPKSLYGEVEAFLRSGGRALAQPAGASAPPSVVDLAAVVLARPHGKADASTRDHPVAKHDKRAPSYVSMSAKPERLTQSSGKLTITPCAALALGLNLKPKTDKDTKSTKGRK